MFDDHFTNRAVLLAGITVLSSDSRAWKRVWSTAYLRLVVMPTPTGMGNKYSAYELQCLHSCNVHYTLSSYNKWMQML